MRALIALSVATLLLSNTANAVNYQQYKAAKSENKQMWMAIKGYLSGVQMGLYLSNKEMKSRGEFPFFCPPDSLTPSDLVNIMETTFDAKIAMPNTKVTEENTDIGIALTFGLLSKYPCK
jgi:hypothetical protein